MCVHMFCVCVHKCIIIVVVVVIYVYGVNVIFLLFYRGIVVDQEFWSVPALFKVFTPIVLYAIMCAVFSTIYLYSVKVIMHQKKKKSFTRKYLIKLILGHCAIMDCNRNIVYANGQLLSDSILFLVSLQSWMVQLIVWIVQSLSLAPQCRCNFIWN